MRKVFLGHPVYAENAHETLYVSALKESTFRPLLQHDPSGRPGATQYCTTCRKNVSNLLITYFIGFLRSIYCFGHAF